MDTDQTIRNLAMQFAQALALHGIERIDTESVIASANKIADFIKDGTVPTTP